MFVTLGSIEYKGNSEDAQSVRFAGVGGYSNVERPCATICVMSGVAFLRWCAYCCCCCLLRRFLTMWMQMKDITIRPSATASSSFACIIASSSVIVRVCLEEVDVNRTFTIFEFSDYFLAHTVKFN